MIIRGGYRGEALRLRLTSPHPTAAPHLHFMIPRQLSLWFKNSNEKLAPNLNFCPQKPQCPTQNHDNNNHNSNNDYYNNDNVYCVMITILIMIRIIYYHCRYKRYDLTQFTHNLNELTYTGWWIGYVAGHLVAGQVGKHNLDKPLLKWKDRLGEESNSFLTSRLEKTQNSKSHYNCYNAVFHHVLIGVTHHNR